MLATQTLTELHNPHMRCGACRYYTHDRCCHSAARLESRESRADECPYFRFSHSHSVSY